MIVLDTNVVSELVKPKPDRHVLGWFDKVDEPLCLTSVNVAEIWFGVALLPDGARKVSLRKAVSEMLTEDFAGTVLPFDAASAEVYGELAAAYRRSGISAGQSDVMIAAIALRFDAAIATRNTGDFAASGVTLHNPFDG